MCGIFGYCNYAVDVSRRRVLDTLVQGLRRLEYRGYDSAGLAVDGDGPGDPVIVRAVGTVDKLEAAVRDELLTNPSLARDPVLSCHVGIAHTRWATHGPPSIQNSHPHASDPDRQFLIVHNGIVTNFKPLKAMLLARGARFVSDTDTEVVAQLAKYLYETVYSVDGRRLSFPRLVMHLMHNLEGAFAMLVRSTHFPNEVIACRRGSPLVVGLKPVSSGTKIQVFQSVMPHEGPRVLDLTSPAVSLSEMAMGDADAQPTLAAVVANAPGTPPDSADHLVKSLPSSNGAAFKRRRIDCLDTGNPRDTTNSPNLGADARDSRRADGLNGAHALARDHARSAVGDAPRSNHAPSPPHHVLTEDNAEFFFSSDASAIVEHTDKVLYLEDGDVVHVDGFGHMDLYNFRNSETQAHISANRAINTLKMELEQIMKGKYPHFMLKEIWEQPETITQTMRGRILGVTRGAERMSDVHLGGLLNHLDIIRRSTRMIFVACGTSYHACLASRQILEELTELPVTVELASDFLDRKTPIFRSDVCVFVSQSGETADTLEALRYVKKHQALTLGIVNTVGSSISRLTDCGVHLNAGVEIGVASTKVYTSQIIVMVSMALYLSSDSRAKQARRREIFEALVELPAKVEACLKSVDSQMKKLAVRYKDISSLLMFGRGYQYATCLEGALKAKETSLVHTEGINAGELKHGPLALVDENMPIVLFATKDGLASKVHNALHQVTARGGMSNLVIVCTEGDKDVMSFSDKAELIQVPGTVDCLQCILSILPIQLLSYHLAVVRGLNVDRPANLAKSVTVE